MNEIVKALQELRENCGNMRGLDGQRLHDQINLIAALVLPAPASGEQYETNSQRVRRLIAAGNYSI